MATHFQNINKVVQNAVSSAKSFIEGNDGVFDEDELDEWLTHSFEVEGYNEVYRLLYDEVVKASAQTYQLLSEDED